MAVMCQCGAPLPRSWNFVALCDPCLDRALENVEDVADAVFVGLDDEEN